MDPVGLTGKLARRSARRPWLTLGIWLGVVIIGLSMAATGLGGVLTQEFSVRTDMESLTADDLIDERFNGGAESPLEEYVIVRSDTHSVDGPEFEGLVNDLTAELRGMDGLVASAVNYYETGAQSLVSADQQATIIHVTFAGEPDDAVDDSAPYIDLIAENASTHEGFEVQALGPASVNHSFAESAESTLQRGEMIGISIALVVLVIVFGALVAAGLPLILAVLSIITSLGLTVIVGQFTDLNFFITNMIFMIGLAVGIDYVLFIVARYREERETGHDKLDAITAAGDTSSKAILFSGLTVVTALSGLLIVPDSVFFSLGMGAILVVIAAVAVTLTLLPAVLSLLGDRINKGRPPVIGYGRRSKLEHEGVWPKIARMVMRRPVASLISSVGVLLALGVIALTMSFGSSGVTALPEGNESREAFEFFKSEFVGENFEPAIIVVDAANVNDPAVQGAVDGLLAEVADDPFFGPPTVEVAEGNDLMRIEAPIAADSQAEVSIDAVKRLRSEYIPAHFDGVPAEALVTGGSAYTADNIDLMTEYMPIVFTFVLSVTFVLLLLAFRSLVVPIKAIVLNLISVFAAYGLIALVFQHGVGADLFGFQKVDHIDYWIPLMMFAILFGLSMDYHIFLLSRIKENFDRTGDNNTAVAGGLASTGSIITGAALIMVGVFGGFALGDLSNFQQMGFGLAAAVVIDATIVRSVLVPSAMVLLGNRNWYFPSWLGWLPKINVEGHPSQDFVPEPAVGD